MQKKKKLEANRRRHKFLNEHFFPDSEGYEVKRLGDWVLVRQWSEGQGIWNVAIWDSETFEKVQSFGKQNGLF